MLKFRLSDLLREKEYREHRNISWAEVGEALGISRQTLATLASGRRRVVTNTAHVEALCRYFRCRPDELMEFDPPVTEECSYHIDNLYPGRRTPTEDVPDRPDE